MSTPQAAAGDHGHATLPGSDEKAALAGTNGTPSGTNKYVTDSDPRLGGGGGSEPPSRTVTVSAGQTSGSNAADPALVGMTPIAYVPKGADQPVAGFGPERPAEAALEERRDQGREPPVIGRADVVAVETVEPAGVEAGRAAPHRVEVEPLDRLACRDDLLVVAKVADMAHTWICERIAQDRAGA